MEEYYIKLGHLRQDTPDSELNFFYIRLSPGGYVFIHDYSDGFDVYRTVNEFMADKREGIICLQNRFWNGVAKAAA